MQVWRVMLRSFVLERKWEIVDKGITWMELFYMFDANVAKVVPRSMAGMHGPSGHLQIGQTVPKLMHTFRIEFARCVKAHIRPDCQRHFLANGYAGERLRGLGVRKCQGFIGAIPVITDGEYESVFHLIRHDVRTSSASNLRPGTSAPLWRRGVCAC